MNSAKLSPRERQIKKLDRDGKERKEIAAILGISPNTVYAHLARIRLKTVGIRVPGLALVKLVQTPTGKTR